VSARTGISWTDATWNPVTGCSRVSSGCEHCYAEALSLKRGWSLKPWTAQNAAENVVLHPERLTQPLHWRKPRRVFVNSMSDLFHERVPDVVIAQVFDVMASATLGCERRHEHDAECWTGEPHTFQVLTKRPERMREVLQGLPDLVAERMAGDSCLSMAMEIGRWPLPNVWLGVSVEDQRRFDERVEVLGRTPAAVRFVSLEPLLGPIDLGNALDGADDGSQYRPLDWVIVGGESGPGHRPMGLDWLAAIVDECRAAGVPVFVKQDAHARSEQQGRIPDELWALKEFPA
jgi:protein gp37